MTRLTVNIDNQIYEKAVRAFLEELGLNYSIDTPTVWWEDEELIKLLDKTSEDLKSGKDKGISFEDLKKKLINQ